MHAPLAGAKWQTRFRTTGEVCETLDAKDLWRQVADAAWDCADPGVQYDSTINRWHTCPNTGRINASNPCSEYMFLDDTACNLSSVNLTKFLRDDGSFDVEGYRHACRVFFIAQEILVDLSSYPTATIARNSHDYRPLGLGYANLGHACSCRSASRTTADDGRAIAAALTAIMCGHAYRASAEMAAAKGPFAGFAKNREPMLRVMRHAPRRGVRHRSRRVPAAGRAARDAGEPVPGGVRGLGRGGPARRGARLPQRAGDGARADRHDRSAHGLRHDRHRAGLRAREVQEARRRRLLQDRQPDGARARSGASATREREVQEIVAYVSGTNTLLAAPHINRRTLKEKGFTDAELAKVEARHPGRVRSRAARSRRGSSARRRTTGSARPGSCARKGLLAARAPRLHAGADRRGAATSSSGA